MGLGSEIRDPEKTYSAGSGGQSHRIPDPGVKKAPDPGSGSATLNCGSGPDKEPMLEKIYANPHLFKSVFWIRNTDPTWTFLRPIKKVCCQKV
jgi:hypothetical protein